MAHDTKTLEETRERACWWIGPAWVGSGGRGSNGAVVVEHVIGQRDENIGESLKNRKVLGC